ncbi:bifunctional diguanylate cyclase/phosphodiesterase [Paraburkholderia hayleyella]|uniref:bifunctional diguanylate cyclase/phosphodiesterase n=1 Tax=Paraburkholderia hayleyella TaxID=2152889 RepID=UPI001291691F|nr:EAL domain-containing protein [Paraburkholderia hayleyella]
MARPSHPFRFSHARMPRHSRDPAVPRRRALLAIPLLGVLVLVLLWTVVSTRLALEKEATYRESIASAAILSAALEQHTIKAIHQIDQITRFVKYEFEKSPGTFELTNTVAKSVVQDETLIQVSLIDEHGMLVASTANTRVKPIDLSDREHFKVHQRRKNDELYISKPVLGRVSGHWTLQMTRRLNHPDGSFAGVVVVSEDPAYFTSDFYNNPAIGRDGMIAVIADNGDVLARMSGNNPSPGNALAAAGRYSPMSPLSGSGVDPLDKIKRITSYRHIDGYPLGVMVGLAETEEFADYNHTRNIYLLMSSFISFAIISFFIVATGLTSKLLGREREITHLIQYDLLTGLPNRYATLQNLRREVTEPTANVGRLALLLIDLDNFKALNDALGHNAGDIVLQMTASRLASAVEGEGTLSRMGGDEFAVIVKSDAVQVHSLKLAEAIVQAFAQPFAVHGGNRFTLHASIGIALYSVANENEIDLLKKADLALYSAKTEGKNGYQFYAPSLSHRADHLLQWEQQLRAALVHKQLFLVYQPKIDLTRRCITGFEALVHWNHPEHGLIPASEFIPVAESTGLIVPMGDFVIQSACRQLAQWQHEGVEALTLAVNISAVQFWRGDLLASVAQAIREAGIAANRLELEITETTMMEYPDLVAEKIVALKRLGVRIALDDFGTGYSSLSYLNRFSVDTLKVDRSFVQAVPVDHGVCLMVTAIVNLARSLGLTVVVEGTETEEQIAWLSALGQIEAQGTLFSRPVPVSDVPALLERFGVCEAPSSSCHELEQQASETAS